MGWSWVEGSRDVDAHVVCGYPANERGPRSMPVATMAFRRCVVNSPDYGSDDDHIGSRVFFDLAVEDEAYANVCVDVRQLVRDGTEHEPLLVSHPDGYNGPLNFQVFQCLVEFYYRQAVGDKWGMLGDRGIGMRLEDWVIEHEMLVQFELYDDEAGWGASVP